MTLAQSLLLQQLHSITMKILLVLVIFVTTVFALPRQFRAVPGGGKIVGGEDAIQGQLPYQLSLLWFSSHVCGASLIAPRVAMTAAHCVEGDEDYPELYRVVAGELNRNVDSGREQELNVERIVIHANYSMPNRFANDIALLFLSSEVVLNEDVKTIDVPASLGESTTGNIRVSGWGATSAGGSLPQVLKFVDIPVVPDDECQVNYPDEKIEESMLCAGLAEGGKDSCQGDSGGPLVSVDSDSPTNGAVVGIVSWGYGCAAPGFPGVNTEVSYFIEWIEMQKLKYL